MLNEAFTHAVCTFRKDLCTHPSAYMREVDRWTYILDFLWRGVGQGVWPNSSHCSAGCVR